MLVGHPKMLNSQDPHLTTKNCKTDFLFEIVHNWKKKLAKVHIISLYMGKVFFQKCTIANSVAI